MIDILVINSDQRNGYTISHRGAYRLHFVALVHPQDLNRIRGMSYDDVVWVRPLRWEDRYREQIEDGVKVRIRVRD